MDLKGLFLLVAWMLVLLTGCASVQEIRDERIARNAALFNSFSPKVQQMVRDGIIDIGFTRDMVRIAWGEPSEVFERKTASETATVWRYARTRIHPHNHHMFFPSYYFDSSGNRLLGFHSVWVDRDSYERYTVARVEFSARGIVLAIEQLRE